MYSKHQVTGRLLSSHCTQVGLDYKSCINNEPGPGRGSNAKQNGPDPADLKNQAHLLLYGTCHYS